MTEHEQPRAQPLIKFALIITLFSGISRFLGFVRETVIAGVFGVGAVTDAYAVALRFIGTATLLVVVYFSQIFVPAYIRTREQKGEEEALCYANNALGVALAVNILFMAALFFTAPLILNITGFDEAQNANTQTAIRILLLQLPVAAFINLFSAYLQARKRFLGPNFIGIPFNIVIITVCLIAGVYSGVAGISTAWLLGFGAQFVVLAFWMRKEQYRFRLSLKFNTPELRADIKLLFPALLGSAMLELNMWVDTLVATHLDEGIPAAVNFAIRLISFVQGLVIIPIVGMVYTYMSEYAAKNDVKKMLDMLWKTVTAITFIVLPMVIIAIPSSFDIVQIVYQRGRFTPEATVLTGTALMWYLPKLLGVTIYVYLVRMFFALQDTKTPMYCSVISVLVNIGLSIWLASVMGIAGLALATTIGGSLSAALLLLFLRRKLGPLGFGKASRDIFKMLLCAVPCILAALAAIHFMSEQHAVIRFGLTTLTAAATYLAAALLLKVAILSEFFTIARGYLSKRKKGDF